MELEQFTSTNAPDDSAATFDLENDKLLDVTVDGSVLAKAGSMVAYDGDLSFSGKATAEGGLTGFVKDSLSSEGTPIMKTEGSGHLYLADQEKKVQVLDLDDDESISVNGDDVLAFESDVDYEISTVGSLSGMQAGGLTNVFLSGPGQVAITSFGDPLVLDPPVRTDPAATVAWSGSISPGTHVEKSLSDMVGQESGERFQLDFTDEDGFVVVQPFEEGP